MTRTTTDTEHEAGAVDLDITGMTCASCAARIEKRLNRVEGVTATVNFATPGPPPGPRATSRPTTSSPRSRPSATGASVPDPEAEAEDPDAEEARSYRTRLLVSTALTVPVVLMAMVPALQVDGWQWISLALATPVVTWGAWPFHRATFTNLRHGAATMDTLVSMGVLAAYGWSLYALFLGDAGTIGLTHALSAAPRAGHGLRGRSTWRWRPASRRSCWPGAPPRPGPAAARAPPSGPSGDGGPRRRRPARRRGGPGPGRAAGRGRPLRRPPRREGGHRRHRGRGDLRRRRVHAHR